MEEEVGKVHPSAHTPSQQKKEKPLVVIDEAIAAATQVIAAAATTEDGAGAVAAPSPRMALGNVANLERSREAPSPSGEEGASRGFGDAAAPLAPPRRRLTPRRRGSNRGSGGAGPTGARLGGRAVRVGGGWREERL